MASIFDQFQSPAPVDVAGSPFQDQPSALSKLIFGQPEGPDVRDPQRMAPARYIVSGGKTLDPAQDAAWDDATASPRTKRVREIMGSEPMQRLMMLSNFIGPPGAPPGPSLRLPTGGAKVPGLKTSLFSSEGLPIQGKDFSKASTEVLKSIAAGTKGDGPMDLSSAAMIPDVPQAPIERWEPPRGISPRMQDAMSNPAVSRGITESMKKGIELGADKWYHTEPIRRSFVAELGETAGQKAFSDYMDLVAATSPRSDVPTNVRNASFYYWLRQNGFPVPDKNPYPYGHVAQNLHKQNVANLSRPSDLGAAVPDQVGPSTAWDIFKNPKPASFSHNLQGNLTPVTVDTHAFKNIGMRTKDPRFLATSISQKYKAGDDPGADTMAARFGEINGDKVTFRPQKLFESGKLSMKEALDMPVFWEAMPNANEYGAAEALYSKLGKRLGLAPADGQAAAWSGGGELTGLGSSPRHTFPELMNERILYTARMRGEAPEETLRMFIRGEKPLLSLGAAGAAGAAAGAFRSGEEGYD
jgi:hypothetical protein